MLKSSFLKSRNAVPVRLLHSFLFLALLASPLIASGQSFTMMVTEPNPSAVDAGQDSKSYINLGTVNGFTGNVSLTCAVTPVVTNGPTCTPPATATPPQQVAMSITVSDLAPAGFYTLTVTSTGPTPANTDTNTATINLTVLSITPDYTLAVTTAIFPTSVHAGFPAQATLTVSPINGYSGTVTLSCSSVTPLATPAPSCSFAPAAVGPQSNGLQPPYTSVLTITTTGNTPPPPTPASLPGNLNRINSSWPHGANGHGFSGLWLAFSGLGLITLALATRGRRRRRLCVLSLLVVTGTSLLLVPACATNNSNTGLNGSTPKHTYVFTLTGADTFGVAPSNEATPPSVSLTVD
ncbi:MAG: hypothetical protein WBF04_18665 [Candidatus Sulfotelmatobacter sp.]